MEAYAGGLAVLLAKDPEGVSEVVNDIDFRLTNFWEVIQNPAKFEKFKRIVEAVPLSEKEWQDSREALSIGSPVERAVEFFIHCRQSLAGRMESFAILSRNRTRGGMNEQANAWLSAIEGLPLVHARLKRVVILNRDAIDVIREQDGEGTLFYLDPPYVGDTRALKEAYQHEMTLAQHCRLIDAVKECFGKVMLSGYDHELYNTRLSNWARHEFKVPNSASGSKNKRRMTEVLWCNF